VKLTAQQLQDLHLTMMHAGVPGRRVPLESRVLRNPRTAEISQHVTHCEAHTVVHLAAHIERTPAYQRKHGMAPQEARPRVDIGCDAPTFPTIAPAVQVYRKPASMPRWCAWLGAAVVVLMLVSLAGAH